MKKLILASLLSAAVLTGCASGENKNTINGAAIGAAAGAVLGNVIGNQQGGSGGKGAAIGAVAGAAVGGLIGKRMDKQAKELEKVAETKRTEQGLVSKLKSDILFETGKAELKAEAKTNLAEMAAIMKNYPENVLTVKGFTDSTGSMKTNETLSLKRAQAVKTHLTANGVPVTVVTAKGFGPSNPVGDNKTEEGRRQNRRVEIEVTVDESKVPTK